MGQQSVPRVLGEALGRDAVLGSGAGEEVISENQSVLAPRAQRRQLQDHRRQPMVQLPPEAARLHRGRQILAGGGDDPHIYRFVAGATESTDLPRFDGSQQLGLKDVGKRPDLIEEQRAVVCSLEETSLGRAGVGKGSSLEAEQLRLEERLGNGRAVDVDEGAGATGPGPVEETGHQPFARACLTEQEDRGESAFRNPS
jgi:hypothetical protein